jgi:hypothetical protein
MANIDDVDSHNGSASIIRLFFFSSSFLFIMLGSHELCNGKKTEQEEK